MALEIHELHMVMSGGTSNVLPANSLGGAMSTAGNGRVLSQLVPSPLNLSGVIVTNAYGNALGVGSMQWSVSNNALYWKAPNESQYVGKTLTGDGVYVLGDSAGYVEVDVTTASLPVSDTIDNLTVTGSDQNVFNEVPESTSLAGGTFYRCIYINNTGDSSAFNTRMWIAKETLAGDIIEFAIDTGGVNATAIGPLVDEEDSTDLLAGLTWQKPLTYGNSVNLGTIPSGQKYAFWLRQTVPPETRGTVLGNTARIALAADV